MQNVKNYFQTLWKSSSSSSRSHSQFLTLSPSLIHFTDSTLADLQQSQIDEKLLNEISQKLIGSVVPPKLQICRHENQWFALNNSHLLIYRQLERIGLCDTVVCDLVRNEDIPLGIRNILLPSSSLNNGSEVMYCSGFQADSCGYFDELTDEEDDDGEDDEEEEEESDSMAISVLSDHRFDRTDDDREENDDDDDDDDDNDDESQLFLTMS